VSKKSSKDLATSWIIADLTLNEYKGFSEEKLRRILKKEEHALTTIMY